MCFILMMCLSSCATTRQIVIMPTLEECPAPPPPEYLDFDDGHIGSLSDQDVVMENAVRLRIYSDKQGSTIMCYQRNVDRLKNAITESEKSK